MFQGTRIREIVNVLDRRKAHLYHACQYADFISYLQIGGIPSRAHLEAKETEFTAFDTDDVDQENAVWDKVFLNLSDFGSTFARGQAAVPNPYGPILLRIRPSGLLNAEDVAVCLRSAGAQGFDRERESLETPAQIERLFSRPLKDGKAERTWIKYAAQLQKDFKNPGARDPEVSCSFAAGYLSYEHVDRVSVDPYVINGTSLEQRVRQAQETVKNRPAVLKRGTTVGAERYNELADLVRNNTRSLANPDRWNASDGLKQWARAVAEKGLDYQFKRYADYLQGGTFGPLAD